MRTLLTLVAGMVFCRAADAADIDKVGPIQTDPGVGCSLFLGGVIVPGDGEALRRILDDEIARLDNYPWFTVDRQIVLCLESRGGSYAEALDMAKLIHDRAVTTRILPGGTCLSACALVFMGGNLDTRSGAGSLSSRYMHPTSRLGFHAPSLDLPPGAFDRDDVQAAYAVAIDATGTLLGDAQQLRFELILIEAMFTHLGDDFHDVTTVDQLALYDIDLYGYAPPQMSQAAGVAACWNAFRWRYHRDRQPEPLAEFLAFTAHVQRQGEVFEFAPFDGFVHCRHERAALDGGDKDHVIQSEYPDMRNPLLDAYWPAWIRLPGPSPLSALGDGTARDF